MAAFDVWDVVKVPFPYADRPVRHRRPALVMAVHDHDSHSKLLWILMITSAKNKGRPGDVPVTDLASAGLPAPSVIRTCKIATVDAAAAEKIGVLGKDDRPSVSKR